jgi:cytochrome c556
MPSKLIALAAAALIAATSLVPVAQAAENRNAMWIKYRQGAYTVLGTQFGIMGSMASGKAPFDAKEFQLRAERAAFMGQIVPEVFPAGSDAGAPTKAKPEIWKQPDEFKKLMDDLQVKLAALSKASASGNLDTIKPAFGAAGQACKACHDKFKND